LAIFESRGYRGFFFVSLILSTAIHLVFIRFFQLEVGPARVIGRNSILILGDFNFTPPGRGPGSKIHGMEMVKLSEKGEPIARSPEAVETVPERVPPAQGREVEARGMGQMHLNPFEPDSLDLLFAFPSLWPYGRTGSGSRRLFGLQRALQALRRESEGSSSKKGLTLDTKYGPFGISSRGILLGPLTVPLPLAPYSSDEARREAESHEEIRAQGLAEYLEDPDLGRQRDRVLEWKRRREGDK